MWGFLRSYSPLDKISILHAVSIFQLMQKKKESVEQHFSNYSRGKRSILDWDLFIAVNKKITLAVRCIMSYVWCTMYYVLCVFVCIVLHCIGCIVRCIVGQPLANLDVCSSSLRILTAVIWKYFLSPFPFVYLVYSSKYVTTALILFVCVVTIICHKMQSCKLLYISYYYSLFTFPADMSEEAIQNQHERGIEKNSQLYKWIYALIKYMHKSNRN